MPGECTLPCPSVADKTPKVTGVQFDLPQCGSSPRCLPCPSHSLLISFPLLISPFLPLPHPHHCPTHSPHTLMWKSLTCLSSLSLSFRYILVAVQELLGEPLRPLNNYTVPELLAVTRSVRQADSSRSIRQVDSSRSVRQVDSSRSIRQADSSSNSRPYVAANLTWQELGEFRLGDGVEYGGFVNRPLRSGADYETTLFGERFDGMIIVYSPQKFCKSSYCDSSSSVSVHSHVLSSLVSCSCGDGHWRCRLRHYRCLRSAGLGAGAHCHRHYMHLCVPVPVGQGGGNLWGVHSEILVSNEPQENQAGGSTGAVSSHSPLAQSGIMHIHKWSHDCHVSVM